MLCGLISIHSSWRIIYFIASAIAWTLLAIIVFVVPETGYKRWVLLLNVLGVVRDAN